MYFYLNVDVHYLTEDPLENEMYFKGLIPKLHELTHTLSHALGHINGPSNTLNGPTISTNSFDSCLHVTK